MVEEPARVFSDGVAKTLALMRESVDKVRRHVHAALPSTYRSRRSAHVRFHVRGERESLTPPGTLFVDSDTHQQVDSDIHQQDPLAAGGLLPSPPAQIRGGVVTGWTAPSAIHASRFDLTLHWQDARFTRRGHAPHRVGAGRLKSA